MRKSLADIVLEEGLVDEAHLVEARTRSSRAGEPLMVALVEARHVAELDVLQALHRHLRLPLFDPRVDVVDPDALREVSHDLALRRRLLPLSLESRGDAARVLRIAMADPTDGDAVAEVEISTGCRVDPLLAQLSVLDHAIRRAYRGNVTAVMRPAGPSAERASRPFGGDDGSGFEPERFGTEPFHRVENEAPLAVRIRALVELLQERGLLDSEEYADRIRRLLKGDE